MSKVGKKPISIPDGVEIQINDSTVEVKGKEGSIIVPVLPFTKAEVKDQEVLVSAYGENKQSKANWGTMRALTQNAVTGATSGFLRELEIQGVGYRAALEGNTLVLYLGFSHPIKFSVPPGIKINVEKNFIKVSGIDKSLVGQVAAKIRELKKPEPYQGKGIRYKGELVKRKAGKKVASATGAAAT